MRNYFVVYYIAIFISLAIILGVITRAVLSRLNTKIDAGQFGVINTLMSNKEYGKAVNKIKKIISYLHDEELVEAHKLLGDCYYALEQYSTAVVEYKLVGSIGGYSIDNELKISKALYKAQYKEEALATYMNILKHDMKNYKVHFEIGKIYFKNKQYDFAYEYFSKAYDLNKTDKDLLKYRGACAIFVGKDNDAYNNLIQALQKKPEDSFIRYYIGLEYSGRGDFKNAIENFTIAAKDLKYTSRALYETALCRIAMQELDSAITDLAKASELSVTERDLHLSVLYTLATCYETTKQRELAVKTWEAIVLINKNYKDVNRKMVENIEALHTDSIKTFFYADIKSISENSLKLTSSMALHPYMLKVDISSNYVIVFTRESFGITSPVRIVFVRISREPLFSKEVLKLLDYMRSSGVVKASLVTCGLLSTGVVQYGAKLHIDIMYLDKVDYLVKKSLPLSNVSNIELSEDLVDLKI